MFEYYFRSKGINGDKRIEAISCGTAIEKYISKEEDRQSIEAVYGEGLVNHFLCPDVASFEIWQKRFLSLSNSDTEEILIFEVKVKSGYEDYASKTYIHMSYM